MPRWTSEDLANYERRKIAIAAARVVDSGSNPKLQYDKGKALEPHLQGTKPAIRSDKGRVLRRAIGPILRVTIVAFTRRQIDSDSLSVGCKYVRDAIASDFGLDDNDRNFEWNYTSAPTRGQCGVIVTIEPI